MISDDMLIDLGKAIGRLESVAVKLEERSHSVPCTALSDLIKEWDNFKSEAMGALKFVRLVIIICSGIVGLSSVAIAVMEGIKFVRG